MAPRRVRAWLTVLCLLAVAAAAAAREDQPAETAGAAYPRLLTGVLASAALGDLPPGVLLDLGDSQITQEQLDQVLAAAPEPRRESLGRNALLLVQEMATKRLLLRAARQWAADEHEDIEDADEPEAISLFLQDLAAEVAVTDDEVARFHQENRVLFEGKELDEVRETLRKYVLKLKRQEVVDGYVRTVAGAYGVVISRTWLEEKAASAQDNDVDRARASGMPTLVDFGANGCQACEEMAPILATLREKYAGRANVVFVHVREEELLAARFGIRSIPVQVLFDRSGEEVFRHSGFLAQDEIEKKLAELCVK